MDDPAFPDSHYTTTATTSSSTTTTTVQTPPVAVDRAYLTSIPGILRMVQIAVNLLYWILLAACLYVSGFPLSVSIVSWVMTIFFFVLFLLSLDKRIPIINWVVTELLHNLSWTVLHFIAACIVAADADKYSYYTEHGCRAFSAVLGFAVTILYGVSTFFSLRIFQASGGLSQLTGGRRAPATTTTTVTTSEYPADQQYPAGQQYPAEKGGDMPPAYTTSNQ